MHARVVSGFAATVAARLGLDDARREEAEIAGLLHDIGKLALPDRILDKPGPLDAAERALVQEHPAIGERILRAVPGLASVADAVRASHERFDGDGYPDGLAGEEIPLVARIVAVCDTWHVMTSDRPYRKRLGDAEALTRLRFASGHAARPGRRRRPARRARGARRGARCDRPPETQEPLRQTRGHAHYDGRVPPMETVGAIRARRVRAALRSTRWRVAIAVAAIVGRRARSARSASTAVARLGARDRPRRRARSASVLIVLWIRASGSAEDDFLTAWGRSHDLSFVESPDLGEGTPLLREGDERRPRTASSASSSGDPLTLCHYTYTVVTYSTDSNGVQHASTSRTTRTPSSRIDERAHPRSRA